MDEMTNPTKSAAEGNASSTFTETLKILAYPIAAASGLWAANKSVHNSAYDKAKALGAFDDILEIATPNSKAIHQDRIKGITTLEQFTERAALSKANYQAAALNRMENVLGLNSFKKKWNYMAKAGKQMAVMEGLTVTGIAIGALLMVAESKTIHDFLFREKEKKESKPEL